MKTLIIGAGEVGQALRDVISTYHETCIRDIDPFSECPNVEVIHICYPNHDGFVKTTKSYIQQYQPRLTIIHSSVPVGTTRKCGKGVVYSPIRGRHRGNGLASELKKFTKFVAGNATEADMAMRYFQACEWPSYQSYDIESLEFCKLISNVHMGLEIAWRQEIERIMEDLKLNSSAYKQWENSYAEGYKDLGQWHLMRPRMSPDPIGGHCILPCTEILTSQHPSKILDFILESNERAKNDCA